jgi:hypothetical protein
MTAHAFGSARGVHVGGSGAPDLLDVGHEVMTSVEGGIVP